MRLGGNCTTQETCAYIVYIANEVEPTGRCGYTIGLQLSTQMYFYFFFNFDKSNIFLTKVTLVLNYPYCFVDQMRFQNLLICIKW